jgi:hypothetical protein
MLPLILSIIVPGLGQLYYGKNIRGVLMLLLGLTPLYPAALIWSVIDIIRLNRMGITPHYQKKDVVWTVIILVIIIPAFFLVLIFGGFSMASWYSDKYIKPKQTIAEGNRIMNALNQYKKNKGIYPDNIQAVIGDRPVRKGWTRDAWEQNYIYELVNEGKKFRLISMGKDKRLGTDDDIVIYK